MSEPWNSLGGWTPDPDRPGFLRDPTRPGWARTADGRWWSQADIDRARVVVDEVSRVLRLEFAEQRRLATSPGDRAADERSLIDPVLVRLLKEAGRK